MWVVVTSAMSLPSAPVTTVRTTVSRREGAVLLAYYVAYTTYLILAATQHSAVPTIGSAMLYFVLPLTFLTLRVLLLQERRRRAR